MTESLALDTFASRLGETFAVTGAGLPAFELRLAEAIPCGAPLDTGRQPFSLVFHGPLEPVMRQRIAPLTHAELGTIEIFLVPIGPERGAMRYQAVFG